MNVEHSPLPVWVESRQLLPVLVVPNLARELGLDKLAHLLKLFGVIAMLAAMLLDVRPNIGGLSVCVLVSGVARLSNQFRNYQFRVAFGLAVCVQTVQQFLQLLDDLGLVLLF